MTTPDVFRDAEHIADVSEIPDENDDHNVALTDQRADATRNERRRKAQSAAKTAYIDRLLRDLDIMIYCELSALYYMEWVSLHLYISLCNVARPADRCLSITTAVPLFRSPLVPLFS